MLTVAAVVLLAHVPLLHVVRRMVIEVPLVVFAVLAMEPEILVPDDRTYDVLTDAELMGAHRPELPFGFDPRAIDSLPG